MFILEQSIFLSHSKSIRVLTTFFLLSIIFGVAVALRYVLSNEYIFKYFDLIGILSGILLLIWFIVLFIDSWKTVKVNEKSIEVKLLFFKSKSASWDDVIKIKESKTSLFKNFVQGRVIFLITKQGEKIDIAEKFENFNLFYLNYICTRMFHR